MAPTASDARYRHLFEMTGAAIFEEDFSAVERALVELRQRGVTDLRRHFAEHPELVRKLIALVRVVDVNPAAIRMFGARDKAEASRLTARGRERAPRSWCACRSAPMLRIRKRPRRPKP